MEKEKAKMEMCTVARNLEIVPGTRADYESLSHYHYREPNMGPYAAIFALKGKFRTATQPYFDKATIKKGAGLFKDIQQGLDMTQVQQNRAGQTVSAGYLTVGVIVYSMPTAGAQMRNIATGGIFAGLDRSTQLKLINKNIRTISRVIIEPRFRLLGLAVRLVRETMPIMDVPFVEALAVMGRANPFFEKAGLTRYDAPISASCVRLIEAFSAVGIDEQDLIDSGLVQNRLSSLVTRRSYSESRGTSHEAQFIEDEMTRFLQSYGERRLMPPGIERTRFVLNKLTDRPVYYLWKNINVELRI